MSISALGAFGSSSGRICSRAASNLTKSAAELTDLADKGASESIRLTDDRAEEGSEPRGVDFKEEVWEISEESEGCLSNRPFSGTK